MKKLLLGSILLSLNTNADFDVAKNIQKFDWNGLEVTYIEDNRFPVFDMGIYFSDGAVSDLGGIGGETEAAFNMSMLGTTKYTRAELSEKLEFFGASSDVQVTHEYTTLSLSGLSKDIKDLTKLTCEVLREANYPENEVKKVVNLQKNSMRSLENNHGALASRIFREVSLSDTPFSYPTGGKLKDLDLLAGQNLRKKMDHFLNLVKKRIYLTGPKSVLEIRSIIENDCRFSGTEAQFVRTPTYNKKVQNGLQIVFAPVEKANQVQVMVGTFLNSDELVDDELAFLSSEFLGGGFTSRLMQEIRVKRGLTYSVGAVISSQKTYGRALISTFTKNETIVELIKVIRNAIATSRGSNHQINDKQFSLVKQGVIGSYPFKFEKTEQFLSELMITDHTEKKYEEIFQFQDKVKNYTKEDVAKKIEEVFNEKRMTIFVLGDKSLLAKLKKLGKVKVVNTKSFI